MSLRRCIISDLDGTLVDSEILSSRAFRYLLPDLPLSEHELYVMCCGVELAQNIRDLHEIHGVDAGPDFAERFRNHMSVLFETELQAFPGVAEVLARVDCPVCVASNSPADKIRLSLDLTGLRGFFGDQIVSAYDIGAWKPDPAIFLNAAERLGFAPEECIVLEDSVVGLQAAKAAGMTVLHFDPFGGSSEPLRFANWQELPDLLIGQGISLKA